MELVVKFRVLAPVFAVLAACNVQAKNLTTVEEVAQSIFSATHCYKQGYISKAEREFLTNTFITNLENDTGMRYSNQVLADKMKEVSNNGAFVENMFANTKPYCTEIQGITSKFNPLTPEQDNILTKAVLFASRSLVCEQLGYISESHSKNTFDFILDQLELDLGSAYSIKLFSDRLSQMKNDKVGENFDKLFCAEIQKFKF